jgi:hypothetical protein
MMNEKIQTISTCHLIFELLHDGEGNLYPEIEPIGTEVIVGVLRSRHGDLGNDPESWAKWFLGSPNEGTPDERVGIATALRIRRIEKDALRRIDGEDQDQ